MLILPPGEDVGHYGGSYKCTYDLYKKYGEMRLLDTPICGAHRCWAPRALRCTAIRVQVVLRVYNLKAGMLDPDCCETLRWSYVVKAKQGRW